MKLKKRFIICSFWIFLCVTFLNAPSFSSPCLDNFSLPNFISQDYSIFTDLQRDLGSISKMITKIIQDLESVLGLDRQGDVKFIISILFYLSLGFFIVFWIIELIFKLFKKIFGKEHREIRAKKVARFAFKATLLGNLLYFCLTAAGLFSQAVAMSHLYKTYIKKPENLIALIKGDKTFLVIFGMVITFYLVRRRLFK